MAILAETDMAAANALLNVPKNLAEWNRWSFNHAQDHLLIIQTIQQQGGPSLAEYQLDPINFGDTFNFLRLHAQTHLEMNEALQLQSIDLSETDFSDPNQVNAWVYSNYQEHNNVHLRLGI